MSRADILAKVTDVLAVHIIECTGLGEVTCRGCRGRGWMSWGKYRAHLATVIADALTGELAAAKAEALREAAEAVTWVRPEKCPCKPEDIEACCGSESSCDRMRPSVTVVGADWLRDRADQYDRTEA